MGTTWSLLLAATIIGSALQARSQAPAGQPPQVSSSPSEAGQQTPSPAQQPAEPLTPERRGDIYMARKMYREAIESYRRAPQNSAVIANKIGIGYHQMMELELAKKQYERALKINPKYAEAINNIGTVHYARRSYRRAVGQYRKALKLSPDSASIYSNLGTAYFARKKYKDASEAYAKAISLDPDVFEHRSTHGVLLQERNIEERAKFHYYLAKLYAQAGMNERALLCIRRALEEGFKDRKKFVEEPEFASLQELAEFKELLALQPRVL